MNRKMTLLVAALFPAAGAMALDEAGKAPELLISAPKLLISKDGALVVEEGKDARRFETLKELARALAGLRGQFQVEAAAPSEAARGERIEARPDRKERAARISAGDIPAIELVRFLADYSGLTVIHDSTDKSLAERMITLAAPIANADDHLVKRLLEANHFRLIESSSGPEGRVLLIESTDAPAAADEPRVRPIIIAGGEDAGRAPLGSRPVVRKAKGPAEGPVRSSGLVLEEIPDVLRAQVDIPDGRGILVSEVDESVTRGTSDFAALQRFDIITNVNDVIITTPEKLTTAINALVPGEPFQIRVVRKGTLTILPARKKK